MSSTVEREEITPALEEKQSEKSPSEDQEPTLIPHRIFLNQVDSYHAKHIAAYITDQLQGDSAKPKDEVGELEGEGEAEMEMGGEDETEPEEKPKKDKAAAPTVSYEVVGTLRHSWHDKTEDILHTLDESQPDFIPEVLKCGFVIYDITVDEKEIPKALATLSEMEKEVDKVKAMGPKTFKMYSDVRVFILVSTVMTWAQTKPIDKEDPDVPFTEADYRKRRAHKNYLEHIACEKEVIQKGRKYRDKLKTYVICSGITYGAEEEDLTFLFKLAWYNEQFLPILKNGNNLVPLIHVKDLAKIVHGVCENQPTRLQYILAVEQTPCSFKQIVTSLSKAMGGGRTKEMPAEEFFLFKDATQKLFDRYTVNLNMEPGYIVEFLALQWESDLNLADNMKNIVEEFKIDRNLLPIHIIIHGPHGAGKTTLAKKLCDYYGCHYVSIKTMIDETIEELKAKIEDAKNRIKYKEEKEKIDEEAEEEELEEEETSENDDWQEQLRDIETILLETGKLPDEYVVRLMKQHFLKNICQNQGYVLDNYPKTLQEAKELFGHAVEAEPAEEPEPEEIGNLGAAFGGVVADKTLPHFVISLQASDEFLCQRIRAKPEREIEGTHFTEEEMIRRLAEFRENNTEDETVLNFFDENEIHPIIINVADDSSEDMSVIFCLVTEKIGQRKGFQLTPEEEEALVKAEQQRIRLLEDEAELQKEILLEEAKEQYHEKMEEWTQLLEEAQMQEEKMLAVECEPLREYLMQYVFPILAEGLIEVARIKPNDPVDFLAEYLFKNNPMGKMFDPSYTRDGELLISQLEESIEETLSELIEGEIE